jgi:hypothetical protein
MKYSLLIIAIQLLGLLATPNKAWAYRVSIGYGVTFTPDEVLLCIGDTLDHTFPAGVVARQVSKASWDSTNGYAPLPGGITLNSGTGQYVFSSASVYYFRRPGFSTRRLKVLVGATPNFQGPFPLTQTVCQNGEFTISVSGTPNIYTFFLGTSSLYYQRDTAQTFTGFVPPPNAAGLSFDITVEVGGGSCSVRTPGPGVRVNGTPNSILLLGSQTQYGCLGDTFTFNLGGLGTPPNEFQLIRGTDTVRQPNSIFTIPNYSYADTGIYKFRLLSACGPPATQFPIYLKVAPLPTFTKRQVDTTVCLGRPVKLRVKATMPVNAGTLYYFWRRNGALQDTGATFNISSAKLADAGTYIVEVQNKCEQSVYDTVVLSVLPAPNTQRYDTICSYDQFFVNGVRYATTGVYPIFYARPSGCDSVSYLNLFVKKRLVSSLFASICVGDSFYFGGKWRYTVGSYRDSSETDTSCNIVILGLSDIVPTVSIQQVGNSLVSTSNGSIFQWYRNGVELMDSTGNTLTPTVSGVYYLIIRAGGCLDTSNAITITLTGTEPDVKPILRVYPNPTRDELTIHLPDVSIAQEIRLYDMRGGLIYFELVPAGTLRRELFLARLGSGMYRLQVSSSAGLWHAPIVVQP